MRCYDLRKISTDKAIAPPKTRKSKTRKRILGFDFDPELSELFVFLDFFLLFGGSDVTADSSAGIGAVSVVAETGDCVTRGGGVGLGGVGAVGTGLGGGVGAAGTGLGGGTGAGGGDPGPAKGEVVTLSLGPPELAPTTGAPGTLSFRFWAGGVGGKGCVIGELKLYSVRRVFGNNIRKFLARCFF